MKTFRLFLMAVCMAVFATGCASGVRYSEYRTTLKPPADGQGRIWFYRPSAGGAAVQPNVNLDDQVVGRAKPHGFFFVDTSPGLHRVQCTTEWPQKAEVMVTTNQNSYVRLDIEIGIFVGHIVPREVSEAQATEDMQDLHLIDTN
jgi:hypothetical protein